MQFAKFFRKQAFGLVALLKERLGGHMPQGDKSAYSNKQKRRAEHIAEGYEKRGTSHDEAEARAWATVNKATKGGKKNGSGRGKKSSNASSKKGGKTAVAKPTKAERSKAAKKAAATRKRQAKKKTKATSSRRKSKAKTSKSRSSGSKRQRS